MSTPHETADLLAGVTAAQRLHEVIEHAEGVFALPPEPPNGTTVQVIGGANAGWLFRRRDRGLICSGWAHVPGGTEYPWSTLLYLAGPAGVRIVQDGAPDGD